MSELLGQVPPVTDSAPDPVIAAWAAYSQHVRPPERVNSPACGACCDADRPSQGCETGVALYDVYRAARIAPPIAAG